eukprot:TRINITY_DN12850_c0_g1_i1.p1 TRINITY_DN12850_c0_g1~~TRINITY_DN12850_c0_g1_i1.p1  ORF type:complete len:329 (+),score=51.11 TRINITY_DN12850_c0_g1_i1:20-1006(+)
MGPKYSRQQEAVPALPATILVDEIVSNNCEARRTLCASFEEHGYAVLKLSPEKHDMLKTARATMFPFFDKPEVEKKQFELPPPVDPLLPKKNRGYVWGPEKEYMKIRVIDGKDMYPEGTAEIVQPALQYWFDIVWTCFLRLAQGPDADAPPFDFDAMRKAADAWDQQQKENPDPDPVDGKPVERSAKWATGRAFNSDKTWGHADALHVIEEFAPEGSSISFIRYYKKDDKQQELHSPCDEHQDTGLLTCIFVSETPGLEMLDQKCNQWLELEKQVPAGYLVVQGGLKLELLVNQGVKLKAAEHRVRIPENIQRCSSLLFMDIPRGPDD